MDRKWRQLSKQTVFSCPYYQLSHDRYCLPNGTVTDYYYVDIAGSTMVIPRLDDGRFVFTRQYRYLLSRHSLEFPAGGLPRETDPLDNARKELLEETGYVAGSWRHIGEFAPYNGVSNELCHVFVASDLRLEKAQPEITEEISILRLSDEQVSEHIRSGILWDGMTIASYSLFNARR